MIYSEKVMEHFQNPRNVGVLKDADGVGQVGNPVCGDMMTFYVKVKDSEMAKGRTLEEAMKITNRDVAEELGGLPKNKLHCSNLGADALREAIKDYQQKIKKKDKKPKKKAAANHDLLCPYCDGPLEGMEAFCQKCQIELEYCPECGEPFRKDEDKCPHCGATKIRV